MMFDSPTADRSRVDFQAEAAVDFGCGKAIRSGRFGGEELAQEWFNACGPVRGVIAARNTWEPGLVVVAGDSAKISGIKFVKTGAAQFECLSSGSGRNFATAEGGHDFTDQRSTQTVKELAIMFFIARKMAESRALDQCGAMALRAFRRPPLRYGLLQVRRANSVHLCSHTCPGLNAHCPGLLATQQHYFRANSDLSERFNKFRIRGNAAEEPKNFRLITSAATDFPDRL